ncbi:MBL fold metallo-hydrolase [Pontibacterium granulatum]|uniref:MBL fold metallo-hydrolase n=1 Tax=Pontibacterium granulatum TaxID=2036029 RepID=UPI00249C410B|nr:MBL fold metallo-hydrolase [Pontibacterium granulatum]MDI3324281.1 MBL fold metallo-hydrolase [Pontibacterium granulatum]
MPIQRLLPLFATFAFSASVQAASPESCDPERIQLQVLGSGGPELNDLRASTSYLVWLDGKARVMIDVGGGSSLNFEKSGAQFADLDAVLFTHLHVDHSADWPVFVKGGFFTGRDRDLPVYGPYGNHLLPAVDKFQEALLGLGWSYLSNYLVNDERAAYKLPATVVNAEDTVWFQSLERVTLKGLNVNHGPLPAVAWRVEAAGCSIVFSGDTSAISDNLTRLATSADLLVAHNAIPEEAIGVARRLHMPPSRIGEIAAQAGVKKLVLSHRMLRTLERESDTLREIHKNYQGPVEFADDLSKYKL